MPKGVYQRTSYEARLDSQIAKLKSKLALLEEKKQRKQIGFEWVDETTVTVTGVNRDFVRLGGMARLREFIQKRHTQVIDYEKTPLSQDAPA